MSIIKNITTNGGEDAGRKGALIHYCWECKYTTGMKNRKAVPQKN
jgi:hypothetical protein